HQKYTSSHCHRNSTNKSRTVNSLRMSSRFSGRGALLCVRRVFPQPTSPRMHKRIISSCQLSRLRPGSNRPQPHQSSNDRPCSSVVDFCDFTKTQPPPYLFTNLNVFLRRPGLARITGQEPL